MDADNGISIPAHTVVALNKHFRSRGGKAARVREGWEEMYCAFIAAVRRRRVSSRPVRLVLDSVGYERLNQELCAAREYLDGEDRRACSRIIRKLSYRVRTGEWRKPVKRSKPPEWSADLRSEAEALVYETTKLCARVARRKSSELSLPSDWKPRVKISWSRGRSRSRGGRISSTHTYGHHGGISLVMHRYVPVSGDGGGTFSEYKMFADDPTIGAFQSDDWRDAVKALVAHEVAHAIQYWIFAHKPGGRHRRIDYKTAHGQGFRMIYALLRGELVNPSLRAKGIAIGGPAGRMVGREKKAV